MEGILNFVILILVITVSCREEKTNGSSTFIQNKIDSVNEEGNFEIIDPILQEPKYKYGSNEELIKIFTNQLKYPNEICIQGTTVLSFIVDKNGKVINPTIKRSLFYAIDSQLLQLISKFEFIPGSSSGEIVESQLYLPIIIKLE